MSYFFKNQRGFSLVEVVVASLIFGIATAGLFSVFRSQGGTSERTEKRLEAVYVARTILEELRTRVDPENWSNAGGVLTLGTHVQNITPPNSTITYTATYNVTEPRPGIRRVDLTVTWNEPPS